jgi:tRNA(fMet)-specific endonuclease VapC
VGRIKYLLDTNIFSEPLKASPDPLVMRHLERKQDAYCTCVIVWREMRYGWARMPESRKKERIGDFLHTQRHSDLTVLPFDQEAADWLGRERARLESEGSKPACAVAEIAAIAVTRDLTLVTRNTADFQHFAGLSLENWFAE